MLDDVKSWIDMVQTVALVGVGLASWIGSRTKANRQSIEELLTVDQQHNERLAKIETTLENSISHDDLRAIYQRMEALSQQTSQIQGEMKQINQTLLVITEHLMGKGSV